MGTRAINQRVSLIGRNVVIRLATQAAARAMPASAETLRF